MKFGFSSKIRMFILIVLAISLISNLALLAVISSHNIDEPLKNDLSNIIWGSLIIIFAASLYFLAKVENMLAKALAAVKYLIGEISKGNYNVRTDIIVDKDPVISKVFDSAIKMQEIIIHYDNLKKEKIIENRNRILSMINLSEDGFIILGIRGNIIFLSDNIKRTFKNIEENIDLVNTYFQPDFELSIKKHLLGVLKSHTNLDAQAYYISSLKRHINVKSSIIRDSKGIPIGIVACVSNLNISEKNAK
ncbi:MAG: hypothetical protein RBS16_06730 [Candidatus Cloacimonadales bacterium]|jgi:hypothetical protein|nr:hypothetical protein [Candidatus Cloacimonadota bacterium]MDX9977712.1 hypothetical protein [Candidatus Cloacimonadales bacterium]